MRIEESSAAVLGESINTGLTEHFDKKHFMTSALGEAQKRLIPRHLIVTQIADDE